MTTLTLSDLTFHHDDARIIDGLSLTVHTGEVVVVLGPSGSGKTTLLRLAGGLETPDSGRVLYDGTALAQIPLKERKIGMVFQEHALFPHLESGKSVGFFLKLRQREDEVTDRVREIASITGFDLEQLMGRFPRQLSGGEQQRLAIARALTRDLDVLLFDEPFAHLDEPVRQSARLELKRLLERYQATTLYVTHDQTEAQALATRVVVLREGRIEQMGTYETLHEAPATKFVAEFVGTPPINLFPGHAFDGTWTGRPFGPLPIRSDLPEGHAVTLGVRPTYIHLAEDAGAGAACTVESTTPFFAQRLSLLSVRGAAERWKLYVPLDGAPSPGDEVSCTLEEKGILFFDGETGARIG